METVSVFDWLFILTAVLFNLLIAGFFIAEKHGRESLRNRLGKIVLFLFFPLLAVFIQYLIIGKETKILIYFGLVFLYLFMEVLLDFILKVDFRTKWITHAPYILLEYAALFSLLYIAIDINKTLGWLVGFCFWILIGSLVYLYTGKKRK